MWTGTLLIVFVCTLNGAETESPANALAVVDGRRITLEEYKTYLWEKDGKRYLQAYIDRILLEKKADALGVEVTKEEIGRHVEERVQREIELSYGNSIVKWKEGLARQFRTPGEYKERLARWYRVEILREKCVMKTREVTDATIKKRFEKLYGKDGLSYDICQLFFSVPRKPDGTFFAEEKQKKREKAERVLRELKDGANFREMVELYSEDKYSKKYDGRIPYYKQGQYGEAFDKAVLSLTEESPLSGIVQSQRGFHIILLLEKKQVELDTLKDEIRTLLKEEEPSPGEKYEFIRKLREQATIKR